ncbi:MAG: GspE/PulE family protein [Candidatus Eremiobacteraeota bacterium]|nr:GspE/PulE family protein [Candidatus Eremiobacteraeota bacterium]
MHEWLDELEKDLGPDVILQARNEAHGGRNPAEFLVEKGLIPSRSLLSLLSRHYHLPSVELELYHPQKASVDRLNESVMRRFTAIPLFELDDHLFVAVTDPDDLTIHDFLRQMTGLTVEPVIATKDSIIAAINKIFLTEEKTAQAMGTFAEKKEEEDNAEGLEALMIEDESAPVIKLVNYMISQAVNLGASDLHLELFPDSVFLRYRVDGILYEFPPPPLHLYRAIVSRFKIISNLDVAERRMPQDGRASFRIGDDVYDLRVSIIPNVHGEGIVIRILATVGRSIDLEDLGFNTVMLDHYKKLIKRPFGLFLVTGPTGSGKSTTLYGTLKHIYTPKKKIITIEDPVEYQLKGITQIQVNSDIDFTFARGLRSILRHDPDIVMLGEIRDLETAEIAIRSSLTGHMVFSTLHTNDAASAVTRLLDMGIASYLIFASLLGVLAQRLVRRLCPKCRKKAELTRDELQAYGVSYIPEEYEVFEPAGCQACGGFGYKGRLAVYEYLEITNAMRRLPASDVTPEVIKRLAVDGYFRALRDSALEKFFEGETSIEEVLSVTAEGD